jgi:hypothetical protein
MAGYPVVSWLDGGRAGRDTTTRAAGHKRRTNAGQAPDKEHRQSAPTIVVRQARNRRENTPTGCVA